MARSQAAPAPERGRIVIAGLSELPSALVECPQWVCWRWGAERPDGKRAKTPYDPRTGRAASVSNPSTWATFAQASAAVDQYSGLGFVLSADDPFVGVDLDRCRDPETGAIEPWASEIVAALMSYTEVSPSGTGLRMFVRGTLPSGGRKRGQIEVYDRARFFTVTGNRVPGTPETIEERTAELAALHASVFGAAEVATTNGHHPPPVDTLDDEDRALLLRAHRASNADKFIALWTGDWQAAGYPSQSEADQALCSFLAYWSGGSAAGQVDRLFRRSLLYRPKWDKAHHADGQTYGQLTIAKALRQSEAGTANASFAAITAPIDTLPERPALDAVEAALRAVAKRLNGADPLRRATVRQSVVERLARLNVPSATKLVDAALRVKDEDSEEQGRALVLKDPEPWPDSVDGKALLHGIEQALTRFVVLPPGAAVAIALWTVYAHAYDVFEVSPLLAAVSPTKRCGKTTLFKIIKGLVPRPAIASNITSAVLFRAVEQFRPTLLIDEADTFLKRSEELRGLLNAGHTRDTAVVFRNVGDDHKPRAFSTWCPKAIAMIGKLPDTLHDRAVVARMKRRGATERVERFRESKVRELVPLCRQAARWAREHQAALRATDPPVPEGLDDRAADNWRPLLTIADRVGGDWPTRARSAALGLSGVEQRVEDTLGVQLLHDIRELFDRRRERAATDQRWPNGVNPDRLPSADLAEQLAALEDRPWAQYRHGKPLTQLQLSRLLAPFGVGPKNIRVGSVVVKGYDRASFEDAFGRYPASDPLQPLQTSEDAGLDAENQAATPDAVADPDCGVSAQENRHVAGVAAQKGVCCPECGEQVPLSDFEAHWQAHLAQPEAA